MNKPISMVINETRISLTDICNKSGLPACVLEPIVRDLYEEIKYVSSMQLKQDTEDLKGRHKEVCEHAEKLEGLVKEQEAIIEALREELKERDEAKCIPAEPRVYESVEEKRDSMYRHLVEEECFYEYQIREFKHRIIEGTQVDLAKAKLKDAKKNLKRIKRVKKAALK